MNEQATSSALRAVHDELVAIASATKLALIDLHTAGLERHRELQPTLKRLLQSALALTNSILELSDDWHQPCVSAPEKTSLTRDYDFDIDTLAQRIQQPPLELLADMAFIAQSELTAQCELLATHSGIGLQVESADSETHRDDPCPLHSLVMYQSMLWRVEKSLAAFDLPLSLAECAPPRLKFRTELALSLHLRTSYSQLMRSIVGSLPPTATDIELKLRSAKDQLMLLLRSDVGLLMRAQDGHLMRELMSQIEVWLTPPETATGLTLWQELTRSLHELTLISNRAELQEHDADRE